MSDPNPEDLPWRVFLIILVVECLLILVGMAYS